MYVLPGECTHSGRRPRREPRQVTGSGAHIRSATVRLSRAGYVLCAIERVNRDSWAQFRARRLAEVSRRVRGESMRVNAEFAAVERDWDAA